MDGELYEVRWLQIACCADRLSRFTHQQRPVDHSSGDAVPGPYLCYEKEDKWCMVYRRIVKLSDIVLVYLFIYLFYQELDLTVLQLCFCC